MFKLFMLDYLKPEADLSKYNELKEKVRDLTEKLEALDDSVVDVAKASYYLYELNNVTKDWNELIKHRTDFITHIQKESSFEEGNNTGTEVKRSDRNCPYCGLTPLTEAPQNVVNIGDLYCTTCDKFVVFATSEPNYFDWKIRETDDFIIVTRR